MWTVSLPQSGQSLFCFVANCRIRNDALQARMYETRGEVYGTDGGCNPGMRRSGPEEAGVGIGFERIGDRFHVVRTWFPLPASQRKSKIVDAVHRLGVKHEAIDGWGGKQTVG